MNHNQQKKRDPVFHIFTQSPLDIDSWRGPRLLFPDVRREEAAVMMRRAETLRHYVLFGFGPSKVSVLAEAIHLRLKVPSLIQGQVLI